MPKIDSEIGRTSFQGTPMKEFNVPDESEFQSVNPVYNRIQQEFEQSQFQQNSLPPNVQYTPYMPEPPQYYNDDTAAIEAEIRAAKDARRKGTTRLSDGAKKRIEMLLGMTRTTREVNIDGNLFVLQSLQSKEMRDAWSATAEFDGTIQSPFEIRKQLLARSLVKIAGLDADQFVGSTSLEAKLEALDLFDHALLQRLHDEYTQLAEDAQKKFSVKTDKDVEGVVEDLKK